MNAKNGTTVKTTKRYPRVTAGPLRHQYVHRVVAAALIGRDLKKDEEVDHRDRDRLNFHFSNLIVRGSKDHGWVSAKQAWFMRRKDEREKKEWDAFMEEEHQRFQSQVLAAKSGGEKWLEEDGKIGERYESFIDRQ